MVFSHDLYPRANPATGRLPTCPCKLARNPAISTPGPSCRSTSDAIHIVAELAGLAREIGIPLPRLAIAWCLKSPRVSTVILGTSRPSQLTENLLAADDVGRLDDAAMARIAEVLAAQPEGSN